MTKEKQLEILTLREGDLICEAVEGCTDCPLDDNGVCRDSDRWFEERTGLIGEIEELFPLMEIDFFEYNLHKNEVYLKITLIDGELENQRFLGSLQVTYSLEYVKHYDTPHYIKLRDTDFEKTFKYMRNKSFTTYQRDFSLALMERFINEDCDRLKTAFAEYKEIITKLKGKLGHHKFFYIK